MIEVVKAGLFSSIQDIGRNGFRASGVPISGAMDQYAAQLANQLVGNSMDAAVIEYTLTGPILRFHRPTEIAIAGAAGTVTLNDQPIPRNTRISVEAGSMLHIGPTTGGRYGYLAVTGGIIVPSVMNSCSYYKSLTEHHRLIKGMELTIQESERHQRVIGATIKMPDDHFDADQLMVYPGPEYDALNATTQQSLITEKFMLGAESNRMAYLLETQVQLKADEILTAPVQPGTVQLTPSGKLIVLMRDAQTTGGYARVLQLTDRAINQLAQKKTGAGISFQWVGQPK